MSFDPDEGGFGESERELLTRALGHAGTSRKEVAISELESQILLEDLLLLLLDGITQTAIVAAETLGQVSAPDFTPPPPAAPEEPS